MIKKEQTLGEIMERNPEVIPILAQAGLHCIGCHVSAYETLEQGCKAHGMDDKAIEALVKKANAKVKEFENKPKVSFTREAVEELKKRAGKKNFVRIVPLYAGEFDFEAVDSKEPTDIVVGKSPAVLLDPRTERFLRGIKIDYDPKEKDFTARKTN